MMSACARVGWVRACCVHWLVDMNAIQCECK